MICFCAVIFTLQRAKALPLCYPLGCSIKLLGGATFCSPRCGHCGLDPGLAGKFQLLFLALLSKAFGDFVPL